MRRVLAFIVMGFVLGLLVPTTPPPAPVLATTQCSSGSVTTDSTNSPVIVVRFTAPASGNGSCTWTVPEDVYTVDYLIVAGGGGGGSGGGGGGGVVTSFGTTNANNTTNAASTPQSVTPGDDISVTVGAGGSGGSGGSGRYAGTAGTIHQTTPSSGSNSSFGSISAAGGGAGGSNGNGVVGGSSGGDSYDRNTSGGAVAATSSVVGAQSFGNDGGGSPGGSYSAGGGGGGAGAAGGNARLLAAGCGFSGTYGENCTNYYHGGGNGGRGIRSAITGTLTEYGCGGGGGVNGNSNVLVVNGGGTAGCSTAGVGSRYSNYYTDYSATATTNGANATAGAANFGGGGGGTDPEDSRGAAGGSGVVIIRYTLVDSRCPNDGTETVTNPIACPSTVTVSADGVAVDKVMRGTPVSFASAAATMTVLNTPTANPTSGNMSVTVVSGNTLRVTVPSGSSLIGGTYPVTYRLSESSRTSDSYLMVTVEDPDVKVPTVLPIDPRAVSVTMPAFILGSSTNVLVCVIQEADTHGNVTVSGTSATGVTITTRTRGISLSGTRTNVASVLSGITITKASSDSSLVPNGDNRSVRLTISNTDNGGNNSCNNGTSKTLEIRDIGIDKQLGFLVDLLER